MPGYKGSIFNGDPNTNHDIETIKGKYINFIESYYNEAIQKDKQLIQKLKNV